MKKITTLLLLILPFLLEAQTDSIGSAINWEEQLFETLEEQLTDEAESADFIEEIDFLLEYRDRKVNLNQLEAEVAYRLLGMNDYQYYQLQLYIEVYGELATIYELAAVEGFDRTYVKKIWNLVEAKPAERGKNWFERFFKKSRNTLLLRYGQILERQAGYDRSAQNGYAGNPMHLTFKYSFQSGEHFSLALCGEKDAGEQFFRGAQKKGFDHYAFFLQTKDIGILKHCVIGDYNLSFGQGLVIGGRAMGSKGGGAAAIRRFPVLLRATAPMNESTNFRGTAVVLGNSSYSGTLFYSHNFYDGEVGIDSIGNPVFEGSLMNTGYHRTSSEIGNRKKVAEHLFGGHFQIKKRIFECGITALGTLFSIPIAKSGNAYKRYGFSGSSLLNLGADYKLIVRNSILFGEIGASGHNREWGAGILQGVVWDVMPRCKMSALFRYYGRQYVATHASAFAASSGCNDELGLYTAMDFALTRRLILSTNADVYHYSWLKYQIDQPGCGFDWGAKLEWNVSRNLSILMKYQFYNVAANTKNCDYYQSVADITKHKLRCVFSCLPTSWLTLKTEGDCIFQGHSRDSPALGILFFQDIMLRFERIDLGINCRIAFFNTDTYNERIYAYESDLLYAFTIASYYGKGIRYYGVLNYGHAFFDIQLRLSQTFYDDRNTIGSGPSQIKGNRKSEIRAQIIFHIN